MLNDNQCFDLFWDLRENPPQISNATLNKCPMDRPVTCTQAKAHVDSLVPVEKNKQRSFRLKLVSLDNIPEIETSNQVLPDTIDGPSWMMNAVEFDQPETGDVFSDSQDGGEYLHSVQDVLPSSDIGGLKFSVLRQGGAQSPKDRDIERVFAMMNDDKNSGTIESEEFMDSAVHQPVSQIERETVNESFPKVPVRVNSQIQRVVGVNKKPIGPVNITLSRWNLNRGEGITSVIPGRRGFINLGNTCFVSATLQVLSHSEKLRNFLKDHPSVSSNNLNEAFRHIVDRMWSSNIIDGGVINPRPLFKELHALDSEEFQIGQMGDSHEVLVRIMDSIADSIKPINAKFSDRSVDMDSLVGVDDVNRVECTHCQGNSETITPLFEIMLNIPSHIPSRGTEDTTKEETGTYDIDPMGSIVVGDIKTGNHEYVEFSLDDALAFMNGGEPVIVEKPVIGKQIVESSTVESSTVSLKDCFTSFSEAETIPDYDCIHCRPEHRDAKQEHRINRASEILTIVLKRFEYGNPLKISTPVDIPFELDLQTIPGSNTVGKYKLVGIVNHHGTSMHAGHYTARVLINDQWFTGNDEIFTPSNDMGNGSIRSSDAYVLLYEKL